MDIVICTLFPEFFDGPLQASVIGRAVIAGTLRVQTLQIREFATNRHNTVDDAPYGGGAGMLMRAPELAAAVTAARAMLPDAAVVLLSPQGAALRQAQVRTLASRPGGMILVCGRYEGVDERFIERYVDYEICIGDFVLSGGEPAAFCLLDAVARLVPGVLGNLASTDEESFSAPRLEYPQFTRPAVFEGLGVPEVLSGGDHGRVANWRRKAAVLRTQARRPDLVARVPVTAQEQRLIDDPSLEVPAWLIPPRHVDDAS